MSSSLRDIFRRKRQPLDERLPDGMSVDELLRQVQISTATANAAGGSAAGGLAGRATSGSRSSSGHTPALI
jgi:hypothetical protein